MNERETLIEEIKILIQKSFLLDVEGLSYFKIGLIKLLAQVIDNFGGGGY